MSAPAERVQARASTSPAGDSPALSRRLDQIIDARAVAADAFFSAGAARIGELSGAMAERFAAGGRLLAFAASASGWSDAQHVAAEFVHPDVDDRPPLPALAVSPELLELLVRPDDMVIGFDDLRRSLRLTAQRGALTIGFTPEAEWCFDMPVDDPLVRQELTETMCHLLWEHVHVFLEHGLTPFDGAPGPVQRSLPYLFLADFEVDLGPLHAEVRRSIAMRGIEARALRALTLGDNAETLAAAACELHDRLERGGLVLALGNGGSATDAADAVADLLHPPRAWRAHPAIDLTADPAMLTAPDRDAGTTHRFADQVMAYGGEHDVLLAFTTSGDSRAVTGALRQARRRGMCTIAFAGRGGGRIAAESLADHVVAVRSEHNPRVQEAQASAWHALRELVECAGDGEPYPRLELATAGGSLDRRRPHPVARSSVWGSWKRTRTPAAD